MTTTEIGARAPRLLALGALAFISACTGGIGEPGSTGVNSTGGDGGSAGGTAGTASCTPGTPHASPVRARLLSTAQYDNTVQDLLAVGGNFAAANHVAGGEAAQLDAVAVGHRADAAAAVAEAAVASMATWSPCMPPTVAPSVCEGQVIDKIGLAAYRHPLSAEDRAQLQTLFDAGVKEKDFATGVNWFLTGLLQSPDFQYQLIRVTPTEVAGQMLSISGYEMASRMSYFIWNSMPDNALFAAAASGLGDLPSIQTQVARMVEDRTRLVRGAGAFYTNWLTIGAFQEVTRPDPAFTVEVAASLGQSLLLGATQLYTMPSPNISSLFSGESYYMDKTLQTYYGLSGAGTTAFTPTAMTGEGRSGLLTHPGFLTLKARPQKTAPINRGLFVLRNLMCKKLELPPLFNPPPLPDAPTRGKTTRQELEVDHVQGSCASCHNQIDPPGFALEGFDEVGRVRTRDNGLPVDTHGEIVESGPDLNGPFATGAEFLSKVASSATVRACFARQYLEHALSGDISTPVASADQCSVDSVSATFTQSGDLTNLVGLVAASDSFRFRASEGAAN